MNDFTKLQKEYAVQLLRTHQRTFITHKAKDARREFAANCLVGALEIAIQTLEREISDSGKINSNRIRAVTKENDLKIWCAECVFLSEPEECEECRDGFELGSMPTHWSPRGQDKTPKTNADRIRAMSDEEIAGTMVTGCPPSDSVREMMMPECTEDGGCFKCWLDWLKQEARDD